MPNAELFGTVSKCWELPDTPCALREMGSAREKAPAQVLDDDFLVECYKVVPCKRKYAHDWANCPCSHSVERAARRDPKTHSYMPIACMFAKQRVACPRGDECPYSHNLFEYWLHPARFKTELCQFGANCDRPVCFFGHSTSELRPLDASLPPAEACWSPGAALNRRSNSNKNHPQQQRQQQQMVGTQQPGRASFEQQRFAQMPQHGISGSMQAQHMQAPQPLQQFHGAPQMQLQQQILVRPQGAYIADASTCNLVQQQQQVVLMQANQATTGIPAGGPLSPVMGGAMHSSLSVSHQGNAQGGHVPMCMALQMQSPQTQMQNMQPQLVQVQMQGQISGQYSAPGSPQQPVYTWMQVPRGSMGVGNCSVPVAALASPAQQLGLQPTGMTSVVNPCDASGVSHGLAYILPQQQQQSVSAGFVQSPQITQMVGAPGAFMATASSAGGPGFGTEEVVGAGLQTVQYTTSGTPGGPATWQYIQQPVMGMDMGGVQQVQDVIHLQAGMQCLSVNPGLSVGPGL